MPIISNASICSVMRILPNSLAILLPTTPAKTILKNVGANSNIIPSRTMIPIVDNGTMGLTNCAAV